MAVVCASLGLFSVPGSFDCVGVVLRSWRKEWGSWIEAPLGPASQRINGLSDQGPSKVSFPLRYSRLMP